MLVFNYSRRTYFYTDGIAFSWRCYICYKQKLKESGIEPESLLEPLESVIRSADSLMAEPIILDEEQPIPSLNDESEESSDTEDE